MTDEYFDFPAAHESLVSRILAGAGHAPDTLRRAAFDNSGLNEPLRTFINRVAIQPTRVGDIHFQAAKAAGLTEDQIFELVVCAAVGEASRQYRRALAALGEAIEPGAATNAP